MAKLEIHEMDCIKFLGEPFTEVHKWLDELSKRYPVTVLADYHRKFRHNEEGIEEIRKMWGNRAAKAAKLHLKRDFEQ